MWPTHSRGAQKFVLASTVARLFSREILEGVDRIPPRENSGEASRFCDWEADSSVDTIWRYDRLMNSLYYLIKLFSLHRQKSLVSGRTWKSCCAFFSWQVLAQDRPKPGPKAQSDSFQPSHCANTSVVLAKRWLIRASKANYSQVQGTGRGDMFFVCVGQ